MRSPLLIAALMMGPTLLAETPPGLAQLADDSVLLSGGARLGPARHSHLGDAQFGARPQRRRHSSFQRRVQVGRSGDDRFPGAPQRDLRPGRRARADLPRRGSVPRRTAGRNQSVARGGARVRAPGLRDGRSDVSRPGGARGPLARLVRVRQRRSARHAADDAARPQARLRRLAAHGGDRLGPRRLGRGADAGTLERVPRGCGDLADAVLRLG